VGVGDDVALVVVGDTRTEASVGRDLDDLRPDLVDDGDEILLKGSGGTGRPVGGSGDDAVVTARRSRTRMPM
jgi:hypothetical protein